MKKSYILNILMELPKVIITKISPLFSYKGTINTQINLYKKLKKLHPEASENELLNHLLISRIESWPRRAPKEVEYAHYTPLLSNTNKRLEDVIWAIIEWECILSREEYVFNRLSKMGLSPWQVSEEVERFRWRVIGDIEESIGKKLKR